MIAALPMYARPETAGATARLWAAIRDALGAGPRSLAEPEDLWALWQAPDLLLAQTCGLPYRAHLKDRVTLVGTPDFGLPGCAPGWYRSVYVVRNGTARHLDDLRSPRLALNEPLSQSGWAAPAAHFAATGRSLGPLLVTGSHATSARAVAEGAADLAALDAQTWRLLARHDPVAEHLEVVGMTPPSPGLPLITARGRDPDPLARAVEAGIAALAPADRAALGLRGLVRIPAAVYLAHPLPPAPAPARDAA
ncbi:MAG: phosphate/phosphite/phosphonate ABC transporter substrate-binding protein [Rhodosalinus sp.]